MYRLPLYKRWFSIFIKPALRLSVCVLVTCIATDYLVTKYLGHAPLFELISDVVAAVFVFVFFTYWSHKHMIELSRLDAFQAGMFLQQLRVNSALMKLHSTLDVCTHADHTINHENCKAAMRQQLRVIEGAMGTGMSIISTDMQQPAPPSLTHAASTG